MNKHQLIELMADVRRTCHDTDQNEWLITRGADALADAINSVINTHCWDAIRGYTPKL